MCLCYFAAILKASESDKPLLNHAICCKPDQNRIKTKGIQGMYVPHHFMFVFDLDLYVLGDDALIS